MLRSLGQARTMSRIADNDADYVSPLDMLRGRRDDDALIADLRDLHEITDGAYDVLTTPLL